MNWLKNVVIDVAITAVIAIWAFTGPEWAWWVIAIYTPLLFVIKVTALTSGLSKVSAQTKDATPTWVYHVIYAANLVLLLIGEWWIAAAAWAIIWVMSAAYEQKKIVVMKPSKKG